MTGVRAPGVNEPSMAEHTGFILAEDHALKAYFEGMTVPTRPGSNETTPVKVWFRYPEGERTITYPFIALDMIDVAPAFELWTSEHVVPTAGLYQPSVSPTLPDPENSMNLYVRPYLAFKMSYQISVHSRSNLHDRYLMSKFFTDVLPPRPFWLGVPTDNTWRRCELVDFVQADLSETTESGNKRIFRKVYTISLLAEIPQEQIQQAWQVLRVFVPIVDRDYVDDYLFNILTDTAGNSVLDPLGRFSEEERELQGEWSNFVNDYSRPAAAAASATATASDAIVPIPPYALNSAGIGASSIPSSVVAPEVPAASATGVSHAATVTTS